MEIKKEIHFESIIKHEGDIQKYSHVVDGSVYFKDDEIDYITFVDPGNGEDFVATEVTFFFESDAIIMQREGDVMMEQRFVENQIEHGVYQVPEGRFLTSAKTNKINYNCSKQNGEIEIDYASFFSNEQIGNVIVKVIYK